MNIVMKDGLVELVVHLNCNCGLMGSTLAWTK